MISGQKGQGRGPRGGEGNKRAHVPPLISFPILSISIFPIVLNREPTIRRQTLSP